MRKQKVEKQNRRLRGANRIQNTSQPTERREKEPNEQRKKAELGRKQNRTEPQNTQGDTDLAQVRMRERAM